MLTIPGNKSHSSTFCVECITCIKSEHYVRSSLDAAHHCVGHHVSIGVLDAEVAKVRDEPRDEHTSTLHPR